MVLKLSLFIFLTLVCTIILAVSQQKMQLSFDKISLPQLGPVLGVLIFFLIFKELPAKINFQANTQIIQNSLLALVIPLVLFTITYLLGKQIGLGATVTKNLSSLLPMMFAGMLVGAIGEEIGWRGFLQPLLETKYSIMFSSISVGLIWGLWHMGHFKNGPVFILGFLLFTVSASLILSWLLAGSNYNLIISALFHLAINIGFLLFFRNALTDAKFMLVNGAVWAVSATGILFFIEKKIF